MIAFADDDGRGRDRKRKRDERRANLVVEIPEPEDIRRRRRLEKDDRKWLRWYFATESGCDDPFWYEFTPQQVEMIKAIRHAILFGGDQSIAASRGEGKTTLCERMLLKYTLQGTVAFSVLFAATGSAAADSLESIKLAIEDNDRLLADYPEICVPVRALENTPNRAHYQLVSGRQHNDRRKSFSEVSSKFKWCGQEIVLPRVPGAPASGAIIATRGLDAAVRGLKKRGRRPEVAVIDDPDTEDTARSEDQAKKLEDRIDKAIGGLGGQQRGIARVMVTTLQNRTCVSYRFTDPELKPTWKGQRYRYLLKPPDRQDLWDDYVSMYQDDLRSGDEFGRRAHSLYLDNRKVMDAGAEVANPNRFDGTELADGTQMEVSALQRYYNEVARIGPQAVATEYDNDPPEEDHVTDSGLTDRRIQTQLSGYGPRVIPPGCEYVTQGIDIRKTELHYVVRAWRPDCTAFTIEYGVNTVYGPGVNSDEGLDTAIVQAVLARMAEIEDEPYADFQGEIKPVNLTLVDAGWRTDAVYAVCQQFGDSVKPSMGFGKSSGTVQANFTDTQQRTKNRKPGDGWFLSKKPGKPWLVCMDADRWKSFEHDRWLSDPSKPGAMYLWGDADAPEGRLSFDSKGHLKYAKQITAESEVEDIVKKKLVKRWKSTSNSNHWLDASYMASVAANMLGVRLMSGTRRKSGVRKSLAEMARG